MSDDGVPDQKRRDDALRGEMIDLARRAEEVRKISEGAVIGGPLAKLRDVIRGSNRTREVAAYGLVWRFATRGPAWVQWAKTSCPVKPDFSVDEWEDALRSWFIAAHVTHVATAPPDGEDAQFQDVLDLFSPDEGNLAQQAIVAAGGRAAEEWKRRALQAFLVHADSGHEDLIAKLYLEGVVPLRAEQREVLGAIDPFSERQRPTWSGTSSPRQASSSPTPTSSE